MSALGRGRTKARPSTLRPFVLLLAISLLLLALRNSDPVRASSSSGTAALVPVQRMIADAGGTLDRFFTTIGEIERLRADNARLREDNDRLTLENVRLREQSVAAQQSAKLDATARTLPYATIPSSVIARDPSGVLRRLVIASGTDSGVSVGDIVLSEQGVVGRVTDAGSDYSKVLLVTDSASIVSALVQGSRATGIVRGQFGDTLVMDWILQSDPVKTGDLVVTAGLGAGNEVRSLYPQGLLLGRVVEVGRAENAAYQRAVLLPAVDLRKLERVLVVKTTS
ncbi:MAG: rod shape-determining protein MreC [Chloroflexi bacterium]|nr:rod shape-determining protein MreC [Chloroflexota bacterium]